MMVAVFDDFPNAFGPAMRYELWRYDPADGLSWGYHWLNVVEAWAWFAIAAYVGIRFLRFRRSLVWEPCYVGLFVVFGVSDLWESRVVPMWLVAAKGVIFGGIVGVRWVVVRWLYPGRKL